MLSSLSSCSKPGETKFYSISDAYTLGYINKENLEKLADYYNKDTHDISVDELGKKNIKKIKKAYFNQYLSSDYSFASTKDVIVSQYYGTYGNCVALYIRDAYHIADIRIIEEYVVDGVVFINYALPGLLLYIGD